MAQPDLSWTGYADVKGELFKGEIKKKSSSTFVGYRARLAIVTDTGLLVLYKESNLAAPKKIISLIGCSTLPETSPAYAFCLMTSDEKVYAFAAKDTKGRVDIMHAIDKARRFKPAPDASSPGAVVALAGAAAAPAAGSATGSADPVDPVAPVA